MAYTVITVQGTGDEAQYTRIADELVRKSRIYRHLCRKILIRAKNEGINRALRIRYRDELKALSLEFNAFVRYANKRITIADKKVAYLTKSNDDNAEKRARYQALGNMYKGRAKTYAEENAELKRKVAIVATNERFFTKELSWSASYADYYKAEVFLRSVLGYEELKVNKLIRTDEVLYLSTGVQLEAFGREDLEERFGLAPISSFRKTICRMRREGYVKKINKSELWYLTVDGKARFTEIMKAIYGKRMSGYWKDIFKK